MHAEYILGCHVGSWGSQGPSTNSLSSESGQVLACAAMQKEGSLGKALGAL